MNLPPQIAQLAHNKWALGGVAGAVGLGLYVHHRNAAAGVGAKVWVERAQ